MESSRIDISPKDLQKEIQDYYEFLVQKYNAKPKLIKNDHQVWQRGDLLYPIHLTIHYLTILLMISINITESAIQKLEGLPKTCLSKNCSGRMEPSKDCIDRIGFKHDSFIVDLYQFSL